MKEIIKTLSKSNDEEVEKIWVAGKDGHVPYPHELLSGPENIEEIIKKLSEKYVLAVVTSRTKENVFKSPQMKKIESYFKLAITYQDTENHKPHPEPLLLATEKLALLPEECVYVGDAESDVVAAKAAGMKSVIYSESSLAGADANILYFHDLENILTNL